MTITNPAGSLRNPEGRATTGPTLALTGALAVTLIFGAVLQPTMPVESLVPLTATLMFALAAVVALIAWLRPQPQRRFNYWDAAGVLTFIGVCAAATIEPEQMTQFVAGTERPR